VAGKRRKATPRWNTPARDFLLTPASHEHDHALEPYPQRVRFWSLGYVQMETVRSLGRRGKRGTSWIRRGRNTPHPPQGRAVGISSPHIILVLQNPSFLPGNPEAGDRYYGKPICSSHGKRLTPVRALQSCESVSEGGVHAVLQGAFPSHTGGLSLLETISHPEESQKVIRVSAIFPEPAMGAHQVTLSVYPPGREGWG
jgi:hypothetical protein